MKIVSWNVNGLKSAYKRNFLKWLQSSEANIVCLQEIKTKLDPLKATLIKPKDYFLYFNSAKKEGMWGVAIYSKEKIIKVESKMGMKRFDEEGRFLRMNFSDFILINFYSPHGGREKENLNYKLEVYENFLNYLQKIKDEKVILAGDFNVAHKEIDLAGPKENQNNIMFTLEERKQIDKIIELGFVDTFREFRKDGGYFSWWSYSFKARERNLGWRIDYIFVNKSLIPKLKNAFILPEVKGSDHCPIGIEI